MSELNAEQIKKALECCTYGGDVTKSQVEVCLPCPYFHEGNCTDVLKENALSLINELTEENERLLARNFDLSEKGEKVVIEYKKLSEENERLSKMLEHCADDGEYWKGKYNNSKAEIVRKMHSEIKERCIDGGIYPAFVASVIDQIAKEVLESE